MYRLVLCYLMLGILLLPGLANSSDASPYAGQELREIKALSADDVQGYLDGNGMGFAKSAELNHYPGPRHVLDLAEKLSLSQHQLNQTQALFDGMKKLAMDLGRQLVDKEMELDTLFSSGKVTSKNLEGVLNELGDIKAKLRYVHLSAHLRQKEILSRHQVKLYDKIRGYADGEHGHNHKH